METYVLSESKIKKALLEKGYTSLKVFAERNHLNRNTIHNYLRGKSIFTSQFTKLVNFLGTDPLEYVDKQPYASPQRELPGFLFSIVDIICKKYREACVFLFGSRIASNYTKYSDWDIGIYSARKSFNARRFLLLKENVDDLNDDLPVKIELTNFDTAPDWFVRALKHKPEYLGGSRLAWSRFSLKLETLNEKTN